MTNTTVGPDVTQGPTPDTAIRAAQGAEDGPMLAADGTPLKRSIDRALRRQKLRALALVAPLLLFILVTFVAPVLDMLFRSVENGMVADTLPRTVVALDDWEMDSGEAPGTEVFEALYRDMAIAVRGRNHTRLGQRLNYERTGMSSLFRRTGREVSDIGRAYGDAFAEVDAVWEDPAAWADLMGSASWQEAMADWRATGAEQDRRMPDFELADGIAEALPATADLYGVWARTIQREDRDDPAETRPWPSVYYTLYGDLTGDGDLAAYDGPAAERLSTAAAAAAEWPTEAEDAGGGSGGGARTVGSSSMAALIGGGGESGDDTPADDADTGGAPEGFVALPVREQFAEIDRGWMDPAVWGTIEAYAPSYTSGYFLDAVDLDLTPNGIERTPENQRVYVTLFLRTLKMSLIITGACILLGYPVAYLLASLPMRTSNLLLILVLLPFWTSLLVRTSAWKVLLQQQGVINDTLVWMGLVGDGARLAMINNQTGTIIAMTHILLPFMILPLYSVMKTIPPSYVRAAKSLGATNTTAFRRVYFPLSVPGIGAGSILVFILAIGYYITPELVGGTQGTFISNRIAYHISTSLNWGLAAALGSILLAVVLVLYWLYDRLVGIDNVKLG